MLNIGESIPTQSGCFEPVSPAIAGSYPWDQCEYRVRSGLGLEHVRFLGIDEQGWSDLVGYITLNGDSVGNVWRTWFTTGVGDAAALPVELYPNPAKDRTLLKWPSGDAWTLELMDAQGIRLGYVEGEGPVHELDVEGLPAGIYLLRLRQGDASVNKRLSVVR